MTLDNLLRIGKLKPHEPSKLEIERLLAAAERGLADARFAALSSDTRLDIAYGAARNQSDYRGVPVSDAVAKECAAEAAVLLRQVRAWLAANRPELC